MAKDNAFSLIFKVMKSGNMAPDSELSKIPSFMFCRYLGAHPVTILAANEFNKFHEQIPMHIQYKMVNQIFAGKGIFPKMLKKIPKEDHLDSLCKYYKVSREKAKEYRTFLSDEEFVLIDKMYDVKG